MADLPEVPCSGYSCEGFINRLIELQGGFFGLTDVVLAACSTCGVVYFCSDSKSRSEALAVDVRQDNPSGDSSPPAGEENA